MARPQKFRHQREDLSDPKVAEKLGRFVIEIEDLREQRSKIDELLAAAFDAVDDGGFEKKYVRKVVALRAKEDGVRRDEEDGLESYEFAIEKGVSSRARVGNPQTTSSTRLRASSSTMKKPKNAVPTPAFPSSPSIPRSPVRAGPPPLLPR